MEENESNCVISDQGLKSAHDTSSFPVASEHVEMHCQRFPLHSGFLEHWNSQKSLCNIWQRFSCLLDEWIEKICKKFFFHGGFFMKSTFSVLRCRWTGPINLKIFFGHHINYLIIWPFMCQPWFPTRKASKLAFVCFQHQVLNTMQGLKNWSWKQTNVSFEAFLVGNQGWHIKGQMLR